MSTTPRSRKSRLAGAMAAKAVIDQPVEEPAEPAEAAEASAPEQVEEPPAAEVPHQVETAAVAEEEEPQPVEAVTPAVAPEPEPEVIPPAASTPTIEPDHVEPEVIPPADPVPAEVPEPAPVPEPKPQAAAVRPDKPLQNAKVLAGVGSVDLGPELKHLRAVVETGRDQRRYVENLPRRSEKGTYLRLPVHLQDVLAEYCDRNTAPMGDLVAAVMDSYFRDIGALPPLGEGNRPVEKFFEKMRKQQRTYDY